MERHTIYLSFISLSQIPKPSRHTIHVLASKLSNDGMAFCVEVTSRSLEKAAFGSGIAENVLLTYDMHEYYVACSIQ